MGWSYIWDGLFCGGLISGWFISEVVLFLGYVVLFLGRSYFWGGLISGQVLFLGWSYFWGGLIYGVVLFPEVVLFLGSSYF